MRTLKQIIKQSNEGLEDLLKDKNIDKYIDPALMNDIVISLNDKNYKTNIGTLIDTFSTTKSDYNSFTIGKDTRIILDRNTLKEFCINPFDKEYSCKYSQPGFTLATQELPGTFVAHKDGDIKESLIIERGGDDEGAAGLTGIIGGVGQIAMMAAFANPLIGLGLGAAFLICNSSLVKRGEDWLGDKLFGPKDKDSKKEEGEKKEGGFKGFLKRLFGKKDDNGEKPKEITPEEKQKNLLKVLALTSAKAKETGDEDLMKNFNTFLGSITKDDGSIDMDQLSKAVDENKDLMDKIEKSLKDKGDTFEQFTGGCDGVTDDDITNFQEQAKQAHIATKKQAEYTAAQQEEAQMNANLESLKQVADAEGASAEDKKAYEDAKKAHDTKVDQINGIKTELDNANNATAAAQDKVHSSLKNNQAVTGKTPKPENGGGEPNPQGGQGGGEPAQEKDQYSVLDDDGDPTGEVIKKEPKKDEDGNVIDGEFEYKKYKKNDQGELTDPQSASEDDFKNAKKSNDDSTESSNKREKEDEVEVTDDDGKSTGEVIKKEPKKDADGNEVKDDQGNPVYVYNKYKKKEDGSLDMDSKKESNEEEFDDNDTGNEDDDDAREKEGDTEEIKSQKKNPAKIWHKKKNKSTGRSTKNYYDKDGNSITPKEFKKRLKTYKNHKKHENESKKAKKANIKEGRLKTLKELR